MALKERAREVYERPSTIISGPLRFLWKIIVLFLFIGVLVIVLLFFITMFRAGSYGVWAQELGANIEKVPLIGPGYNFLKNVLPAAWSPEKYVQLKEEYTWKATIDENVGNRDLGLEFDKFEAQPFNEFSYIGDKYTLPIIAIGSGHINSLMDDSEVSFECDADDGDIKGEITSPYGPIKIKEGITKYFRVKCEYNGEDFELGDKLETAYTLRLKAYYSFNTLGYLTLYTMSQSKLEENNYNKEIIFSNVDDEHLDKKTGKVDSTYTYGPVKLVLYAWFDQPLTEMGPFEDGGPYNLGIILTRNINWQGTLKEVKNVYIYVMDGIEIEEGFFDYVGDEGIFKKYKLNAQDLEALNKDIGEDFTNTQLWIDFTVSLEEELSQLYIKSEVEYIYQAEEKEVIKFIKKTT